MTSIDHSFYQVLQGFPAPLGATLKKTGVNFALFSEHATGVSLCLFHPKEAKSFLQIDLDPATHRTNHIWHVFVEGLAAETEYSFLLTGPSPAGHLDHFTPSLPVSDPYALSLNTPHTWGKKEGSSPRGRVILDPPFDWGEERYPNISCEDLIIYEMHIRAFTNDPSSRVAQRGTYLGVIEKISFLKQLGINAVELMPIFEFNECEHQEKDPIHGRQLYNFWGYSTVNFFSPMNRYATSSAHCAAINEFKTLVKAFHENGIAVILDVAFNHTAEGGRQGPVFSFRGVDNAVYYLSAPDGSYLDFTGCGNTLNANHPIVTQFIMDSLRYWVREMHVDGFRFDLASALTRSEKGEPMAEPPLIKAINSDPTLSSTKLIAEAWDAAGLYQVGSFPGEERWMEWNGKYRDVVRQFIKGTENCAGAFAEVISGSEHLYQAERHPYHSINFITCHDGFTLHDLVSYQEKHNEENGEDNRDGSNDHNSWNCGHEGETDFEDVLALRERQMRNFHLALMVSIGTPMLLMGDEYGHTRRGNNNAWCQDNELNYFLWDKLQENKDFFRFYTHLIHFRKTHAEFRRSRFLTDQDIKWHGHKPFSPDWSPSSRFVAYTLQPRFYIAFNAHYQSVNVTLPPPPEHKKWVRVIDTSAPPPKDFYELGHNKTPLQDQYEMSPYSAILLSGQ